MKFSKSVLKVDVFLFLTLILIVFVGCQNDTQKETTSSSTIKSNTSTTSSPNKSVFTLQSPSLTGIDFSNKLIINESFNILSYEYGYNGAGVAVGDVNKDGLSDIYFASNFGNDKFYINQGDLKFKDVTTIAGLENIGYSSGVTMADVNGDGLLDIYVCRSSTLQEQYRKNLLYINQGVNNDGNVTFKNEADKYRLDLTDFSTQSYFFDYDKDGDLDLYLVNHRIDFKKANTIKIHKDAKTQKETMLPQKTSVKESDRLFRNENGAYFTDVTAQAGIENHAFGLSASILDINNDGWDDVYVANDFIDRDFLYINQKDGTFKENLSHYFQHISRNSMGSDAADFNNDGLLDLITVDMVAETNVRQKNLKGQDPYDVYHKVVRLGGHHQVMRNVVQLNDGRGGFSEIGGLLGMSHTDWSWTPLFADFDNDGDKDLLITNGIRQDITHLDTYNYEIAERVNKAGGYKEAGIGTLLGLFPSTTIRNKLYQNNGNLDFKEVAGDWGLRELNYTNGAATADFDNDGDLDLVMNNTDGPAYFYRNNTIENSKNHFLRIQFVGQQSNVNGIGTTVTLHHKDGTKQLQVQHPTRGFLSACEPILHFGIQDPKIVDRMEVVWSSGKMQTIKDIEWNTTTTVYEKNAKQTPQKAITPTVLNPSKKNVGINFKHKENKFIDFDRERLLTKMTSREGPDIAVADVNGDQLEDVYIAGAAGQAGTLYVQQSNGNFKNKNIAILQKDAAYEDTGAVFFDADQDGDQDLYVASGGSAFEVNSPKYQDRLYRNDGVGNFSKVQLPNITSSASCVLPFDADNDGDLDIFVGSRVTPGSYPVSPQSYIIINEDGKWVNRSTELLPKKGVLGMVTDAKFVDTDNDNQKEVVLVGDWMPLTILKLVDSKWTIHKQIPSSKGNWNCLAISDIDQDGDVDFIAGNRGENDFFGASPNQPASVYYGDFDDNGQVDPIFCHYDADGKSYPRAIRDELVKQVPAFKKKFNRYYQYANATIEQVLDVEQMQKAKQLICQTYASSIFINDGTGNFDIQKLPIEAQFAPVQSILVKDVDQDGINDLLLVGNDYHTNAETGRYDAFRGLLLKGNATGFEVVKSTESGFYVPEDARSIVSVKRAGQKNLILVGVNDGDVVGFE